MNTALLRLSVRHSDYPGIRLWFCADGTSIAAVPGEYTVTGCCQVMYKRADLDKGIFFGYPTRQGGDERMRRVAREFITHDGCPPRLADGRAARTPGSTSPRRSLRRKWQQQVVGTLNTLWEMRAAARGSVNPLVAEKWVRIMCDYCAEGVWAKGGGGCMVEDLPVSRELIERIRAWQRLYEKKDSSIDVLEWEHRSRFCDEGLAIAKAVKAELPDWTVVYLDEAAYEATRWAEHTPRALFEYEILLSEPETHAQRLATAVSQAGLVAGETRLREGDAEGVFIEALDIQHGRLWVAVRTDEPVRNGGWAHGHRRHFYGDWTIAKMI